MSDIIYLTLQGASQGLISVGCSAEPSVGNRYQRAHTDEIFVFSLQHDIQRNVDGVTHNSLTFCKALDKSSPLLAQAINNNEQLTLSFDYYRINRTGRWEKYYQTELRGASLSSINLNVLGDNIDYEYVSVSYDYIRSRHLIAGTEYFDLPVPESYPQIFVRQPDKKEKRQVTLTLGVFFDGTGNNAVNTRNMLEACSAQHFNLDDPDAVSILEQNAKLQAGVSGTGATSYKGYYTNIHWLNTLYTVDMDPTGDKAQSSIYVEGIGTQAGEPDSQIGLGLGISDTGVIAKTDDAVAQIAGAIRLAFKRLNGDYEIAVLQFDIFGFSRGAAAARHFANRIQQQDPVVKAAIRSGMQKASYSGASTGKIRFIGLFDTVAAIGTPANGLNPHTADTGDVNIRLRPGVAEHVFQITAGNEARFNFASNSIAPGWPELKLPGAHSDIGGGYLPQEREALFLTRPEVETLNYGQPGEQTRSYHRAIEQLHTLEHSPVISPIIRNNALIPEIWTDERASTDRYGQIQKRSFAAIAMRNRIVRNDWSKVTLRVMLSVAKAAGVMFNEIDTGNKALLLPQELLALNGKAVDLALEARQYRTAAYFSTEELDLLAARYIHCSANWNAIEVASSGEIRGGALPATVINFVNRPDEHWLRTVYTMEGKKK